MNRRQQLMLGASALGALAAGTGAWWMHQRRNAVDAGLSPAEASVWAAELKTPQGQTLRLADHRGRWLMVNFWATWCTPCIREMPLLEAFYKANATKNWQLVGIAADEADAVNTFLARQPVSYPVALAGFAGIEMSRQLGNLAGGLPFTVVFKPDGQVAQRHTGVLSAEMLQSWAELRS